MIQRGHALTSTARTLNEAQVIATQDAYDQGYLLMTDPDEMDAIAGAVDQQSWRSSKGRWAAIICVLQAGWWNKL